MGGEGVLEACQSKGRGTCPQTQAAAAGALPRVSSCRTSLQIPDLPARTTAHSLSLSVHLLVLFLRRTPTNTSAKSVTASKTYPGWQ